MKWLSPIVFFFLLVTPAPANPPGVDESVHGLVMNYIHLPCEALEYSYSWMYRDLVRLTNAYKTCVSQQDTSTDPRIQNDPWFGLQCVYIRQNLEMRYDHIKSVEKAWTLMCDEEGRIERRYKIDF